MPDFKGLDPIIVNRDTPELPPAYNPAPTPHSIMTPIGGGANPYGEGDSFFNRSSNFDVEDQVIGEDELRANKRFDVYNPNVTNQEDYAAYGQSWGEKMVSGVGKGLALTATTFLQSTVGMVNGLYQWKDTGKFSSFYNNDFNKALDEFNKNLEDTLPNYYSDVEKNAHWYQGSKLFTANFFWDGIIKNLGFSAGAALSGSVFAAGLKGLAAIPGLAKLVSVGKQAEALAATEAKIAGAAAAGEAAGTYGKVKALSDSFLGKFGSLSTGQKVIVAGLATSGEAGFEAYQNLNQFRNTKIEEYKAAHYGEEPTDADLEAINKEADSIGNWSFGLNVGLLTATNYFQFPKILGSSYTVEKGMVNSLTHETRDIIEEGGKYIAKPTTSNIFLKAAKKGKYFFSISEGFEEGAQFAIQTSTQDYYDKQYKHLDNDFFASLVEGVKKTVGTDEGMENVLIGGLSGAMMMAKGKIQESSRLSRDTAAALKLFNSSRLSNFTKETMASVSRGTAIQEEREQLLKNGDITGSKDAEADYIINYLSPRIKYGRYDLVKSEIESYRQQAGTDVGFEELMKEGKVLEGDTKEAYLKRLDNLEATAESVKSLYQSLHLRYGSKVDANNKLLYDPAVMNKLVYAASKVADYDKRIPELSNTLVNSNVPLDNVIADLINEDDESYKAAIATIDSLNILDEEKVTMKEALEDIGIMSIRRNQFLKEYTEIKASPEKFKDAMVDEEKLAKDIEQKETITLPTQTGDRDLEIGTRYYIGRGYNYDKEGLETYIPISELTIIKDNGDGTIEIRDHNGKVQSIAKEKLAEYKIGKVEDVEKNENASFFYRNRNKQVFKNFGKGKGGKIPGRLSYDSAKDKFSFVYFQNGKTKEITIGLDQFAPKGNFKGGLMSFGKNISLTAEDLKNIKDRDISGKTLEDQRKRREGRLKILNDLYDEVLTNQILTEERISKKNQELNNIAKDIADLQEKLKNPEVDKRYKKEVKYKTATLKAMGEVKRLLKMQEDFEKAIVTLEDEKGELEFTLSYLDDMSQNLDELPTDSEEFLEDLREQKTMLEDLILTNSIQIEESHKIIDKIKASLESMYKYLADLVGEFQKKYPNAPTAIIGQPWIDYLHNNPEFLKVLPNFKEDLKVLEDLVAQVEDLDITPDERTLQELHDKILELQDSLPRLEKELKVKQLVLDKFQKVRDDYKKQKAEEERLSKDKKLIKEALGTVDKDSVPTRKAKEKYEAVRKKAIEYIWRATMGIVRGKDYQIRANNFGANLEKFDNRADIRGVYITHKNEDKLIKGLTEFIAGKADKNKEIDIEEIVAMVMIDTNNRLLGEDGKPLTKEQLKNPLDHVVFQVFPLSQMQWSSEHGGGTMFRDNTPDEAEAHVRIEYGKWRDEVLTNEEADDIHTIGASFGIPDLEVMLDENSNPIKINDVTQHDYSKRNSVESAGLIAKDDLYGDPIITIPRNNDTLSEGTTSYDSPIGLPFLHLPNAVVPLQNRQHTKAESETIFQAISLLAKYMMDSTIGIKSAKAERLLNYLSSVVYWGIPTTQAGDEKETAGYNSIFWKTNSKNEFVLHLGREGKEFKFTPTALAENKQDIITLIGAMYNHVNSSMINKVNEAYEEILSIADDETIISRDWINYQAYLLSDTYILDDPSHADDGKSRNDLPLSTILSPIKEGETNRTGIYFYTDDTAGDIEVPEIKRDVVIRPSGFKPKPTHAAQGTKFKLDNSTPNVLPGKDDQKIIFTAGIDGTIKILETQGDYRKILLSGKAAIKKSDPKLTDAEATTRVKAMILARVVTAIKEDVAVKEEEDDEKYRIPDEDDKKYRVPDEEEIVERKEKVLDDEDTYRVGDDEVLPEDVRTTLKNLAEPKASPSKNAINRIVLEGKSENVVKEDWAKLEKWLAKNFPNLPIYRVKNFIKAANGRQAWGMLQDGALYIMNKAESGTAYHEVFEGVWKMFSSPEEQVSIINEFNSRPGTFIDRPTGRVVNYADATPQEVKEELAEEFRDYIQEKKIPYKPKDGRPFILKLFSDLVNVIKELFGNRQAKSKVEQMFQNIDQGKYKDVIPYETNLSFAKKGVIDIEDATASEDSELSLVTISDKQRSEILQEMTYQVLFNIINSDTSLFNVVNSKKSELYANLKMSLLGTVAQKILDASQARRSGKITVAKKNEVHDTTKALLIAIDKEWDQIIERHTEYLKSHSIEFDENDEVTLVDEKSKDDGYGEPNKIDHLKKANAAIKLLLSTIPVVDDKGEKVRSSIGGVILLPMSQAYVNIMNNVHTSRSLDDMLLKLHEMANDDANYGAVYNRLTRNKYTDPATKIKLSKVKTEHGLRLIASFWKTFKKQNPLVKNVIVLENGEVVVGDAHLSTLAAQLRDDYINNITFKAKEGSEYLVYDKNKKAYVGNPATVKSIQLNSHSARISFLKKLGITFDINDVINLKGKPLNDFKEAVSMIRDSISKGKPIVSFSGKSMDINKRLLDLGYIQGSLTHPDFDSTFFGINRERTQSFIGTNPASDFHDFISQLPKFNKENLAGTQYSYLITDVFTGGLTGSTILKRMFTPEGKRKTDDESQDLMRVVYIGGTDNQKKGKQKQSSKLSYKERFVQELNLNLAGYYLTLVPGDASMEWATYMGNVVSIDSINKGMGKINLIFKEYFKAELELARDTTRNVAKGRNAREMRFFKSILGDALHRDILQATNDSIEDVYDNNESKINAAIEKFIKAQNSKLQENLKQYKIVEETETGFTFENVNIADKLTQEQLTAQLTFLNVNFMINNIELHKLIYADPYQYADELKRIKNFNSPRQALIHSSPEMSGAFNRIWNKDFKKGELGWTNFTQEYFRSTTYKDVMGMLEGIPGYDDLFKETDGGGIISFPAYRHFRIRVGEWNDLEESQYKHDIAYEKLAKSGATAEELKEFNKANPGIRSAYTPIKPIVSGNMANGKLFNDVLLDKFALYPSSYRLMSDVNLAGSKASSNSIALYNKMQAEKIDYIVFENSRKVGATQPNEVYNAKGEFNTAPYPKSSILNVPFSIMSVQTEVPSKDDGSVTRGSQITKLITMDFMEAGVPIDFMPGKDFATRYKKWNAVKDKEVQSPLYKEIKDNQKLLQAMTEVGYQNLLARLGIKEEKGKYVIDDLAKVTETLRSEMLKREVNDNISDALIAFSKGKSILEATPAYQQLRNILYSIADKEVISPKITGGMKILIPSRLFEFGNAEKVTINGKTAYSSNVLNFYKKDGKQVCEIMVARWFKSSMSDAELLDYLNNTDEGKRILSGLAYRIPTQKQNSIESFVIKQFLPQEFGDSVILPAAMVAKTGGDFDIDKLTMYLKNVIVDTDGKPRLIPYLGVGESAKAKLGEMFATPKEMKRIQELLSNRTSEENYIDNVFIKMMGEDSYKQMLIEGYIDNTTSSEFRQWFVDKLYAKSLQNEYIESSQRLVSHPSNYDRLVKPNSAQQMSDLAKEINAKLKIDEINYLEVGNMLDRGFMSNLRHAFVSGKYAIGIAAVNQTNHSLNQRQPIYIDRSRLKNLSPEDQKWIGDAVIRFKEHNMIEVDGKIVSTLSMIKNAADQDISDIIAQFIDGYVDISKGPWIMQLGATPNVAATWMFLVKTGVPIDTVAYFMNQPIIRDYLLSIENAGYSWLFMDSFVEKTKAKYTTGKSSPKLTYIPSKTTLKNNIGVDIKNMGVDQKAQQQFILDEFMKYAKMAEQMFHVTQGSNFDTATFNDPYLIFKKFEQLKKAQNTIISNVDELLANSFVGSLGVTIKKLRDSLATILKSDQKKVRSIIQQVLLPYVDMSDSDFLKLSRKAVNDLFDYAVQTNQGLNQDIQDILINDGGVGREVLEFVNSIKADIEHPLHNNYVISILQSISSKKAENTGVNNIKVKGIGSKTYDQNNIIYGFREIREYLKGKSNLYDRLVQLAVLQSGLSSSNISFTSVLPFEDFEKIYNKTLSKLESIPNLDNFVKLNVFQRNNWNNDDVSPYMKAPWIQGEYKKHYNPAMKFLKPYVQSAINSETIPQVITIRQMDKEANFDHVVFTWEKQDELITTQWRAKYPKLHGSALISQIKSDMRNSGDYSYILKGLFEKVKDNYGRPYETSYIQRRPGQPDTTIKQYVYKAINAWGDGHRANEFYDIDKQSVIDNGFIKVNPVNNNVIIDIFTNQKGSKTRVNTDMNKNAPEGLPPIDRTSKTC